MDLVTVAKMAALEAGALLKEGFGTPYEIGTKEGNQNLVTQYDLASQKLILDKIGAAFPSHHFLAEEEGVRAGPSEEILWIIDPLDGTVNFAHNLPLFSVSIAAAKGTEILLGVVYHPCQDELFIAEKGSGAYLGEKKIEVTRRSSAKESLLVTGFPYNAHENPLHCIDRFAERTEKGIPVRRLGSAAIDLAYVAAGRFDLFWEVGLHAWDMAAGKLLVEEAGGRVSSYDGSEHPIYGYHPIVASNGLLHDEMVQLLKEDLT